MSDTDTLLATPAQRAQPKNRKSFKTGLIGALEGGPASLGLPLLLGAILLLVPAFTSNAYWIHNIALIAILGLVTSGVNLSFGYAGEVQFGQVFMFALGGYLSMLVGTHSSSNIVFLLVIAGVAAAIAGAVIAMPSLRVGGWSLALISFFIVLLIPDITYIFRGQTGGYNGLSDIPTPDLFGKQLGTNGIYECCIVVLILWLAWLRNLVTSRYGVIFRCLRESAVLTDSLGFSRFRLKLSAYTLGAIPAGFGGCLYGFVTFVLAPSAFSLSLAIAFVAASILGGSESVYGAVVAATILQLGPQQSVSFEKYAAIVYGLFLVVAAIGFRRGLSGVGHALVGRLHAMVLKTNTKAAISEAAEEADVVLSSRPEFGSLNGADVAVTDIIKRYGGVTALDGVTLSAKPGQVTGLIGSNGSGKTTLLNVISGYVPATEGAVLLGGNIPPTGANLVARAGVARTFQTPIMPRGVTVFDVIASGRFTADSCGIFASSFRLPRYWRSRRDDRAAVHKLIDQLGLSAIAQTESASLPLGLRRFVEVARAMAMEPSVLLLDEPASGLSSHEVDRLAQVVRAAADAGATVMLIEHNFDFITKVSDVIHVLNLGTVIASGTPDEVARDPKVIESYLGSGAGETVVDASGTHSHVVTVTDPAERKPVSLSVKAIECGYGDLQVLRDLSLETRKGEVEVILGRNGAGKTTLLGALAGDLPLWNGEILLDGETVGHKPAYRRSRTGIALVQEGKRVFRERTVMQNLMLGTFAGTIARSDRQARCEEVLEQFPALKRRLTIAAGGLSGGEQQMLAIGQALISYPRVLLLDEPSAGLAPSIVEDVFGRLRALTQDSDLTIILTEQLAEQALSIASHVSVMDAGTIIASGPPSDFSDLGELQAAYFGAVEPVG